MQHKPYFRLIEPGLHLGYRKLTAGPGTWVVRRYRTSKYTLTNLRTAEGAVVLADYYADANGKSIMSFAQAQSATRRTSQTKNSGAGTVAEAMGAYFESLENEGRAKRSIQDARGRSNALIIPPLGNAKVTTLSAGRLTDWRNEIANAPPLVRTPRGEQQPYDVQGSVCRCPPRPPCLVGIRHCPKSAALNKACGAGAWREVERSKKVDAARIRFLTVAEFKRLINACDPELRPLVETALATGCRYGELCALRVSDFNPQTGKIYIHQSKSGKPRHVTLTEEGAALFSRLCAGRTGAEPLLRRNDGRPFGKSDQEYPMRDACQRAKITPRISFHILRHTWASLSVMAGMPLMVVAHNLGHANTRMVEKHYGTYRRVSLMKRFAKVHRASALCRATSDRCGGRAHKPIVGGHHRTVMPLKRA